VILLAALLACGRTAEDTDVELPFAAPDADGAFAVGVTTVTFVDDRGKSLIAEVWYPANPADGDVPDPYPTIGITMNAYRDAPADTSYGPYPLVAFSHGYGGIRFQSPFLTERLASHGYVVVSPDHPRNTFFDLDQDADVPVMLERPGDIESSVDEVIARSDGDDPLLGGMIDGSRYAMLGHSFGGFTTMAVAGGVIDFDGMRAFCADHDAAFCSIVDDIPLDAELPTPDPRAVVAIPMAPCGWYAFGAAGEGLASLSPSLILGGSRDDTCPMDTEVHPAYLAADPPKSEGNLANAGHFVYSDLCAISPVLAPECAGPSDGYIDVDTAHAEIDTLVTAWLGVNYLDDDRNAPWLADQRPPDFAWSTE
jgi:predicted dienelactone hydrolase